MKKIITLLVVCAMSLICACSFSACNHANKNLTETTVFMVGDSTVCNYTETDEISRYYMRNGYGMHLGEYLDGKATINNLALSGRSSKSFLAEQNYTTLTSSIKSGDYLIIGFGHNDEKLEELRYTNPVGDVTDPTSFKYHLYEKYCKVALDAGATPILCTPIVRRSSSANYTGATVHVTSTSGAYVGGDYSKAIVELGAEKGIAVVDLTTATKDLLATKTMAESAQYYSWTSSASSEFASTTAVDNTHLNAYGAQTVAKLFVEGLAKTNCVLKDYVLATLPEPSTSVLVPNAK